MSDSLPTITLSIIHWQSKTRASEPELCPASEVYALVEHGQDDVPGWCFNGVMPKYIPKHLNTSDFRFAKSRLKATGPAENIVLSTRTVTRFVIATYHK